MIKRPTRLYEIIEEGFVSRYIVTEPGVCDVFRVTDKMTVDGLKIDQHIGVDGDGRFYVMVNVTIELTNLSNNFHEERDDWI